MPGAGWLTYYKFNNFNHQWSLSSACCLFKTLGHTEDYNNTHRAWHNEVRLRIKVATKYIIAMTFQSLETFSLWSNNKGDTFEENHRRKSIGQML